MDNDAIIRRLPHARFEMTGKLDEIEAMSEELGTVPPGNDRANQIKQQMHSKVGDVRRIVDELQPEPQPEEPVKANVVDEPQAGTQGIEPNGVAPVTGADKGIVPRPIGEDEDIPLDPVERKRWMIERAKTDPAYAHHFDENGEPTTELRSGSNSEAHEVVEMEKKINGEWLEVTVWATSAPHLEADGWSKVGDPRPVEEGEKPVESEKDETDHGGAE